MKPVLIFAILAALALGSQAVPSSCDSCKSVSGSERFIIKSVFQMVQSFIEASKDKTKMAQMKVSLAMLCVGTSHQSDCQKTLDKLDYIAYKLAPYLVITSDSLIFSNYSLPG